MTLTFTVPGPPRPKARARTSFFDRHGRRRVNPRTGKPTAVTFTPKRTVAYEAHIATCALAARQAERSWNLDAIYRVGFDTFQCRDLPDRDNVRKALLDACKGILWRDDGTRHVRGDLEGMTYYVQRGASERIEVRVEVLR